MNIYSNGKNKYSNYMTTFKVDADIEEFYRNIDIITFIENQKKGIVKDISKTQILNALIRDYMYKILKLNTDNEDVIKQTWENYKEANKLVGDR